MGQIPSSTLPPPTSTFPVPYWMFDPKAIGVVVWVVVIPKPWAWIRLIRGTQVGLQVLLAPYLVRQTKSVPRKLTLGQLPGLVMEQTVPGRRGGGVGTEAGVQPVSPGLSHIVSFFSFINLFILFIYFWLHWVFVAARRLSLVAASRGYSSLRYAGFSLRWLLLLRSTGSRHAGFSSCGTWAQ